MNALELIWKATDVAQRSIAAGAISEEGGMRAMHYTISRIKAGDVKEEVEVLLCIAAFGDGFCTGYHNGKIIQATGAHCPNCGWGSPTCPEFSK